MPLGHADDEATTIPWVVHTLNHSGFRVRPAHAIYFQLKAALESPLIAACHGIVASNSFIGSEQFPTRTRIWAIFIRLYFTDRQTDIELQATDTKRYIC
jgi:hypothetical protein